MDRQKIFDAVWRRARDKRKALRDPQHSYCMYRVNYDPEGLSCFIGALIPNDEYERNIEGTTATSLAQSGRYPNIFGPSDELTPADTRAAVHGLRVSGRRDRLRWRCRWRGMP